MKTRHRTMDQDQQRPCTVDHPYQVCWPPSTLVRLIRVELNHKRALLWPSRLHHPHVMRDGCRRGGRGNQPLIQSVHLAEREAQQMHRNVPCQRAEERGTRVRTRGGIVVITVKQIRELSVTLGHRGEGWAPHVNSSRRICHRCVAAAVSGSTLKVLSKVSADGFPTRTDQSPGTVDRGGGGVGGGGGGDGRVYTGLPIVGSGGAPEPCAGDCKVIC